MDDLFFEAAKAVSKAGYGSIRLLVDMLGVDYYHGERLIKALQQEGILSDATGKWLTEEQMGKDARYLGEIIRTRRRRRPLFSLRAQRAPLLPLTHPTRSIRRGAVIASTRTDAIGNERIESFCGVPMSRNEPLARDSSRVAMCSVIGVDSGR